MADYRIELGIGLKNGDLADIKKKIESLENEPIKLKIDAETTELTNTIKEALSALSKGAKGSLVIDTKKIEDSLDKLSATITSIKDSLGTFDSKSGMKDLISSINQIAQALGRAENESDSLVKSLSALSRKDLSLSIGLDMGKKNNNMIAYGRAARKQVIPELEAQIKELEAIFGGQQAAMRKLTSQGKNVGFDIFTDFEDFNSESVIKKMEAMEKYIKSLKKLAAIDDVDLDGFNKIHQDASELINDVAGVENAVDKIGDVSEKFKNLFGSGISSEQLDSIVADLKEIKDALKVLSEGASIDDITTSFREMSVVLKDITDDLVVFRNAFGNIGNGLDIPIGDAARELKNNENILDAFKRSLQNIGMGTDEIDSVAERIKNLGVQIETINQSKPQKGVLSVDISGIDKFGNAVKITEQYSIATGELINGIERVSTVQQKAGVSTHNFVKQQKQAVSNLTNQINELNRKAIDQNEPRAIKDSSHLDALKAKYGDIISAIQRMESASSDTFIDEQNNVKKLISEYQSLVREMRNAENVATSLRSKDIDTVKSTYGSKLDVLISKMKSSGVYTSGFESGAENLRSILSSATDASGLVKFLNGLDKLESGYKRADAAVKEFNRSQKVGINVSGLESKIADIQRISPEIDQFETEINGAKVSVKSLLSDLGKVKTQGDFSVVNSKFKAFAEAARAAGIAVTETVTKVSSVNKIKNKIADTGFSGFEQEVRRAHIEVENLEYSSKDLENALRQLNTAMAGVYSADKSGDVKRLVAANEEYEDSLRQVYSQLKLCQQAEKQAYDAEMLSQKKSSLSSEMEIWLKENTKAAKDFGEEIRRLQASLDGLDSNGVKLVGQQFKSITKQAQAMGKTGLTVFDKLKLKVKEYAAYLSAAEIFMYAEQALRDMFEQVKLIDSAMTELKKVTNETEAAYEKFLTNAASRAREIGTTIDGLVSSTADFARLGYGFEDAQGLAEVANIYAVVGDEIEGVEGATESLISTMAAFKDEMNGMSNTDFAMSIIDKFNEIGNNFAISSGGIGEALERSASSLMAANNTIDESIALITAANTVVQDPEQVGKWLADIKSGYIG